MLLNIPTYLRRIGFVREPRADVETLRELALRQPQYIVFENLDAFTGRSVSLVPADVERKLVQHGRGGWCFEQNLLLGNALQELGFPVIHLAARVVWNRPADAMTARTHRLLLVEAEERQWLVDAGFGGQTLTGILELDSELPQSTPHEPFRLRRAGEERVLESHIRGEWLPLCRFDLQPQLPVDFEAANYQLTHDPASHFTQGLIVSRATRGGRHVLRGHPLHGVELVSHAACGDTRRVELHSANAILEALGDLFALPTNELPELRDRLERMLAERTARLADQLSGSAARS